MSEIAFAPIFPGWNVWNIWQVKLLPFSLWMLGVSRDRQLQIFVEDAVRLHSASDTADPIDLKGSQVEIIAGAPGLATATRKEQVPGPAMTVSGPAELRTVRFFNRGEASQVAWPHDESYLLDEVFEPSPTNPATSGAAPTTIGRTVGHGVLAPIENALGEIPWYVKAGAAFLGVALVYESYSGKARKLVRKVKNNVKRSI